MNAPSRLVAALADRYRLDRELGAGGMATVYLAHDLKHEREVALKVLKPELAAVLGAERFVVEIKTTAALQHPHILPLFDSGEAAGFLYYVMPYIAGETLRDQLTRETQLGVEDAVRIASEVADALDYAHRNGVIHRDVKPENILLYDGRAMVADFGIAIAVSAAAGGRMTETGLSLGTPHYMSPEQATAEKELTGRSDVYSLASVLYEMLAGVPPHEGGTAQQTIMRILTEAPRPLTQLRKSVPANVSDAVAKAIEKVPADRFASAKAFSAALHDPTFRYGDAPVDAGEPTPARRGGYGLVVTAALALAAAAAGIAIGTTFAPTGGGTRDLGLPVEAPVDVTDVYRSIDLARDGSVIAYLVRQGDASSIWMRRTRGEDARLIPGTEGAVGHPMLSPDGSRVAFESDGQLRVVSLDGGPVKTIGPVSLPTTGQWLTETQIVFDEDDGRRLTRLDPNDGSRQTIDVEYCPVVSVLADGEHALCGGGAAGYASLRRIAEPQEILPFRVSGSAATSVDGKGSLLIGTDFRLIDNRYLVYMANDGTLMGTRVLDLATREVGRSVPLVAGVRRSIYTRVGQFGISDDGALAYVAGSDASRGSIVRQARDGARSVLPVDEANHLRYSMSPDGRRLATTVEGVREQELRVYDLEDGSYEAIQRGLYVGSAGWSSDGQRLAYIFNPSLGATSLMLHELNSPTPPQPLFDVQQQRGGNVSGFVGDSALLVGFNEDGRSALMFDLTTTPPRVDTLGLTSFFLSISPDRRWLTYQEQGAAGIRLMPWPARDRQWLVDASGFEPMWRSNTELVFLRPTRGELDQVSITPNRSNPVSRPEPMLRDKRFVDTPGWSADFAPNGDLLYLQAPEEHPAFYVRFVPDWVQEMKRMVDAAN